MFVFFTASASAQTVTLHNDSGAGDNINTGSYTPDNLTADTTPKITLAGFTGSIAITASHATASDVTHTLASGNGDYTFTTALAAGEWTITATDSASPTPNTATLTITVLHELVSNIGESEHADTLLAAYESSGVKKVAQSFTVGGEGFFLKEVHFKIQNVQKSGGGIQFELELMTSTGDPSRPGSRLRTNSCNIFNNIPASSLVAGDYVLEIPAGKECLLESNTEYFLVFQTKGTWNTSLNFFAVDSNAQSGESGWSIGDTCRTATGTGGSPYGSAGTWSDCSSGRSAKVGLFGVLAPLSVDLKASSDFGLSDTDNVTNDNTPTIVTSGFTGGTATTITAHHTTDSTNNPDVVATISTGNGEVDLATLADGVWTITAEQGSDTTTFSITIDTTTPTALSSITLAGHAADGYLSAADFVATAEPLIADPDDGSYADVRYRVLYVSDGSCRSDSAQMSSTIPDTGDLSSNWRPGAYKVCVVALDVAGNEVWAESASFQLDVTAPTKPTTPDLTTDTGSSSTDDITNNNTPTITTTAVANATYEWTVDGAVNNSYTTNSITTTALSNGDHTFSVKVTDRAGNQSVASDILTITVDTTAPTVTAKPFAGHLGASDSYINKADHEGTSGALLGTVTTSESSTLSYALVASSATCDATQTYVTAIPATVDVTTDGTYKVCVRVTDTAGNIQYTATPTFTKDTTAPTLSGVSDIGTIADTTPDLTFTTSEAGVLVLNSACGIPASAVTAGENTITLTALTPNTYNSCTFQMTDTAGNTSVATSINAFTIQVLLPVTVTLHNDSGAGDNIDTTSYTSDNLTADTTPKITLSGFSGAVNIRAVHETADTVTASHNGNGDVILPELAEGEWTITAGDNGANSATLTITVLHTLVSNTGEEEVELGDVLVRNAAGTVDKIAQSFTTGGLPFELEEILFNVASTNFHVSANFSFEIELMTSTGTPSRPGSRVTTNGCNIFNGIARSTLVAGEYRYEIPTNKKCVLDPHTEYFLVFQIKNSADANSFTLSTVSSVAESGIAEWSIANRCPQGICRYKRVRCCRYLG